MVNDNRVGVKPVKQGTRSGVEVIRFPGCRHFQFKNRVLASASVITNCKPPFYNFWIWIWIVTMSWIRVNLSAYELIYQRLTNEMLKETFRVKNVPQFLLCLCVYLFVQGSLRENASAPKSKTAKMLGTLHVLKRLWIVSKITQQATIPSLDLVTN